MKRSDLEDSRPVPVRQRAIYLFILARPARPPMHIGGNQLPATRSRGLRRAGDRNPECPLGAAVLMGIQHELSAASLPENAWLQKIHKVQSTLAL